MLCFHTNSRKISEISRQKFPIRWLQLIIKHLFSLLYPMQVIYAQTEESKLHSWVSRNSGDSKSHEVNHHNKTCDGFRRARNTQHRVWNFDTTKLDFMIYTNRTVVAWVTTISINTVGPLPTYHVDGTTENASHAMFSDITHKKGDRPRK